MTTTLITDLSTTITSTVTSIQTAVVKGVLDLNIQTVDMKDTNPETTVSAITSSTTSTSSSHTSSTSSATSSGVAFSNLFSDTTSSGSANSSKIGLAIGIPIAIIGCVLIILLLYLYLRYRKNSAQRKDSDLQNFYDEKYNYRISPLNESTSPYNLKTTYQFKTNGQYNPHQFDAQSSTIVPPSYSVPSIKQIPQGQDNSTKWQTPIYKWFNSSKSAISSRASLSTGIFSPKTPLMALREFNLKKNQEYPNERSPILPTFPEKSYDGSGYSSHSIDTSPNGSIKKQVVRADITKNEISLQHPLEAMSKKKQKPLPKVPVGNDSSIKSLAGLEQIVMERMIPTTPKVDFAKYKNDKVYMVKKGYSQNLADELTIYVGEFVRILARHTDGWCLAEKCNQNGEVIYKDTNKYINEGRGVIPEVCLQTN